MPDSFSALVSDIGLFELLLSFISSKLGLSTLISFIESVSALLLFNIVLSIVFSDLALVNVGVLSYSL